MHGLRRDSAITTHRLTPHVALLVFDRERSHAIRPSQVEVEGKTVAAPMARLETPLINGDVRHLMAFAWPAGEPIVAIRLVDSEGGQTRACEPRTSDTPDGELDVLALLDQLPDSSKVRLALFLLETCRTIFRLDADAAYAANVRQLIGELFPIEGELVACASAGDDLILLQTHVPSDLGPLASAIAIGQTSVRRTPFPPFAGDQDGAGRDAPTFLMAHAGIAVAEATIVLIGKAGLAVRRCTKRRTVMPPVIEFLTERAEDQAAAPYVFECLSSQAENDDAAAALAREVGLLAFGARAPGDPKSAVAIDIRSCVATQAGLFLVGLFVDRHDVVRAIEVQGAGFDLQIAVEDLACLGDGGGIPGGMDFAALAKSPDGPPAAGVYRLSLRLASGAVVARATIAAAATGLEARAEILRSLPRGVANNLIERVAGPAIQGLAAARSGRRPPRRDIVEFGAATARPRASIVMPFGYDRGALIAKAGAFHRDPALAECELVFVLDRPTARSGAERALAGLWTAFGLPSRLVLIPSSDHRAETLGAGIAVAEGETILLLDGDVIPETHGWAQALIEGLQADAKIGLCGGRILSPDGSIRSAGLALVDNADGSIGLEAEFAGFPRGFALAAAARPTIAVSLAMCALRRNALDEVGGLSSGYLTDAWNDADFCARLRLAGWEVGHAPEANAVSFAKPGRTMGLGSDNAARIDAWCFVQYWSRHASTDAAPPADSNVSAIEAGRAARSRAKSRTAA